MSTQVVDPKDIYFTQDSIAVHFQHPHENGRIDHTVKLILEGKLTASHFPRLRVVSHEGRLWSLDNRRLWVFKKAHVQSIVVKIVRYNHIPRFHEFMTQKLELKIRVVQKGFFPRVRGLCQKNFRITALTHAHTSSLSPTTQVPSVTLPFTPSVTLPFTPEPRKFPSALHQPAPRVVEVRNRPTDTSLDNSLVPCSARPHEWPSTVPSISESCRYPEPHSGSLRELGRVFLGILSGWLCCGSS